MDVLSGLELTIFNTLCIVPGSKETIFLGLCIYQKSILLVFLNIFSQLLAYIDKTLNSLAITFLSLCIVLKQKKTRIAALLSENVFDNNIYCIPRF